ncbi:MAG: FG-GAP-like repeat-containing protein [Verrucomicrobiota bacterium]
MASLRLLLLAVAALLPLAAAAQTSIQNVTYTSGQTVAVNSTSTITAGPAVTVASGANVTYQASGRITLSSGFTAQAGGYFRAYSDGPPDPGTYTLTVIGGTGSATGLIAGAEVSIQANTLPPGETFTGWVITSGSGSFANALLPGTTFIMGAGNATITATHAPGVDDDDGWSDEAETNLGTSKYVYDPGTASQGNAVIGGWPNAGINAQLAVGATAGELSVDKSGAATYSIPIWTTPGTAGMEPKIALSYSSQAGAGIAGFGWSLGGVSAVTRGPATLAVDGYVDGVDFDGNDQFYLDGQRLILVGGTHGQAGAEYRTELETFTKVVANGTAGNGPASFTAWTKAGLVIQFGHTADATFDAYGRAEKFSWSVNRITDTKGNYMDFVYEKDGANGVHRLARINYTGNHLISPYASLRFEYEDRPDWSRGYAAGSPVSNLKRLKSIRSCYGESVARTYTLGYAEREFTGRSLLTSLTETGADGKSYPALAFDYGTPAYGWEQPPNFNFTPTYFLADNLGNDNKGYPAGTGFVDLNGDGRTDFVIKRDGAGVDNAQLNTGTGWSESIDYRLPYPLAIASDSKDTGARFVDFDADGLVDFVYRRLDANGNPDPNANKAWRNNGSGWTDVTGQWGLPAPTARDTSSGSDFSKHAGRFVDLNGDGRADFVAFITPGGAKTNIAAYLNTGSGWAYDGSYSNLLVSVDIADKQARFLDLNGDGLPDIVAAYKNGSTVEHYTWLNNGSGWNTDTSYHLPTWIAEKDEPRVGAEFVDLNGDGLIDLIWARETPLPVVSGFALNTGAGWNINATGLGNFTPPAEFGREDYASGGATFMDFNADGLPDLLMARHLADVTSKSVHIGSGSGWQPATDTSWHLPGNLLIQNYTSIGADFVDFDGDGVADHVWKRRNASGVEESGLYRNKANPLADRLHKVTNGLGVAAQITYQTLLNPTVYAKGSGGPAGSVNVTGPMYVVSSVSHDDGVGGQYPVTYQYAGLRSDRLRGSLGFAQMTVTDGRTAIRSQTAYAQQFPFTGMPVSSQTITGSTVLKDTLVAYGEKLLNSGKTRFVFAQDSDETTRDLNGALLGSTSTTIPDPAADIDDYGNIEKLVVDTDGYTKTTESLFTNDATNWFLGRLTSATVTTAASGQTTQQRTSAFTYDSATGLLLTETVQPGDPVLSLTTTYAYDLFGNKTAVTVSGANLTVDAAGNYTVAGSLSRTTETQYDANGRFPIWTKNALGHQEHYTASNPVLGVLTAMIGANGLGTVWAYDGFGRKIHELQADGTYTNTHYRWVAGAPANARYYTTAPVAKYHVETQVLKDGAFVAPPTLAFHDAFGRAFLGLTVNGDGHVTYTTTHHDNMGRAFAASLPYRSTSPNTYWTRTTAFDLLNRPLTVVTPDDENGDQTTSYSYNGLTVEVTDPKGRVARTVKNNQGWTTENTRNVNAAGNATASTVTYGYDVLGNLTSTNAAGTVTSLAYDARGRKTSMIDADMGTWQYRYNVFGELVWQKDAKAQIVTMAYDSLGRLTSRTEAEGTTTWTYDSSPTKGIGKLHTVSAPAGYASSAYTETHLYDTLGRPSQVTRQIDSNSYVTQTAYDSAGRVVRTVYPAAFSGTFSVRHVYNAFGYLKEIRHWLDADSTRPRDQLRGKVYWMADSYDVSGRISGELYGNGLASDRVFSAATGRLARATIDRGVVINQPFFVQDLNYAYDSVGNVKSRLDYTSGFNREERFSFADGSDGYDGLDRLRVHRVVGGSTVTVGYDANGNITNKSDVGGYGYVGYGPHAASTAGANTYTYDAVGNMLTGAGRSLEWTSFNQLKRVEQGNKSSEFAFGAGHERVLQVRRTNGTVTDRTVYAGALYERVLSGGGLIEHKHYILGPTGRIAVHTDRDDFTKDTRWFHTDGLGSITVISDEQGRVLKRHTYDAWGKQATAYTNTDSGITNTSSSTRGFTDHEMLTDFGLIHMNGRVYDPVLGRFLSSDPFIDGADDAQGYNRYSYVGNNPLGATDPTGYFSLKKLLNKVISDIINIVVRFIVWKLTGNLELARTLGDIAGAYANSLLNDSSINPAFKAGAIGPQYTYAPNSEITAHRPLHEIYDELGEIEQRRMHDRLREAHFRRLVGITDGIEITAADRILHAPELLAADVLAEWDHSSVTDILIEVAFLSGRGRGPKPGKPVVSGETSATVSGKSIHRVLASERRASGEFDSVAQPITDMNGSTILVPKQVDLRTGVPVAGKGVQKAVPDAVQYRTELILDDKPVGRLISKDRQEMIRFIRAYEARTGRLPRTIAIQRYDPATGQPVVTEIYKPSDFLPK